MKACTRCGLSKPLSEFGANRRAPDGLSWWCADCRREYQRRWRAENPDKVLGSSRRFYAKHLARPRIARVCDLCGAAFTTARKDQRFCGAKCSNTYHRRKSPDPWNERRRANDQKRRALKAGASTGVAVRLSEIRDRDGDRCGICKKKVNGEAWPHPLSASLDHIIPLSQGGSHDPANVRLTHLVCNTRRGNRGGNEQLRVV